MAGFCLLSDVILSFAKAVYTWGPGYVPLSSLGLGSVKSFASLAGLHSHCQFLALLMLTRVEGYVTLCAGLCVSIRQSAQDLLLFPSSRAPGFPALLARSLTELCIFIMVLLVLLFLSLHFNFNFAE